MTLSHISEVVRPIVPSKSFGLSQLMDEFKVREAEENPGVIVRMASLRLTHDGTLSVPELEGAFTFNEWSRSQLATTIGVRWDRWFARMSGTEQAEEVNRRFAARTERVLVRTSRTVLAGSSAQGTLLALLSETFSPIADSKLLQLLQTALEPVESDISVVRHAMTERSTSFVVGVGKPFRPGDDHQVGDIWGGLSVRNSSVGFAAVSIIASFTRLLCRNGMTAPVPDAVLVRKAHRAFSLAKLYELLAERLRELPGKLANAGRVLVASREREVRAPKDEFLAILRSAHLPLALLPEIERAYELEPALKGTAFGISQAVTRAAQDVSPEVRFELERAAGVYIAKLSPTAN
jgi:hypothetical protein